MDTQTLPAPPAASGGAQNRLASRQYGAINWVGLQTLVAREVQRFMKVSAQTVIAPLTSTVLFLSIFAALLGARAWGNTNVEYINGLVPGLAMMAIISNAFQNSASSLIIAKVQGNAVDFLMPPISALELTIAFLAGSAARGLIVGLASVLIAAPFADILPVNWFAVIYFALMGAIVFGAIGLIGGIWADKFDHLAAVTNFIITPLTMLSGTFFSVAVLPEPARTISHYNPVFFLIDGFRAGFIGHADTSLWVSGAISGALAAALCFTCWSLLKSGWRLKA